MNEMVKPRNWTTMQSLTGKYREIQGKPCNENREPAMRAGFPCNESRFFPVGINRVWVYSECCGSQALQICKKCWWKSLVIWPIINCSRLDFAIYNNETLFFTTEKLPYAWTPVQSNISQKRPVFFEKLLECTTAMMSRRRAEAKFDERSKLTQHFSGRKITFFFFSPLLLFPSCTRNTDSQ